MEFHEQLKRLREKAGLTQEGLARAADLSVSTVTKLERGGMDPSWSTVLRLAHALGVQVQEFAEDRQRAPDKSAGSGGGQPIPRVKGMRQRGGRGKPKGNGSEGSGGT
jgi:transcriptional regulator with XRE-family HTH domain